MSSLKIKIRPQRCKRNLLQLLCACLLLQMSFAPPSKAVLDFPDPFPVSFALANLASYPQYLLFTRSSTQDWTLLTGGSRLFQMPDVQPFGVILSGRLLRGRGTWYAAGIHSGAYSEFSSAVAYGRTFLNALYLEIGVALLQVSIENYGSARAGWLDIKSRWRVKPDFTFSFAAYNVNAARFGRDGYEVPRRLVAAGVYRFTERTRGFVELEKDLRYTVMYRFGFIQKVYKPLWLLAGFQGNPDLLSAGFSLDWGSWRASAAFQYHPELGPSQCYGLSLAF